MLWNFSFHNYSRCWGPLFDICCTSVNFWALVFAYRICTEIGGLHLHFTRTRLLSSLWWLQCSCDGPHKMITAFAITCSENWNKWEQAVRLPCTHCHGSVHKYLPIFYLPAMHGGSASLHGVLGKFSNLILEGFQGNGLHCFWDWAALYDHDSIQVHFTEAMKLSSKRRKLLDTGLSQKFYLDWRISAKNKMSVDIITSRKCQTSSVSYRNTQVQV